MSPRLTKLLEAARATALARELVERWTVEAKDAPKAAKCRALQEELIRESSALVAHASAIYEELRG